MNNYHFSYIKFTFERVTQSLFEQHHTEMHWNILDIQKQTEIFNPNSPSESGF